MQKSINQSIILPGVRIGENVSLERVIVQGNITIPSGTEIIAKENEEPIVISDEMIQKMLHTGGKNNGNNDGSY
ncbi:hypothetical protein GCM10011351_01190 [Paraliobacillus quinghaiensis]|uniref:Glucose-1-phosphate adenylyltransferase/Bifunctional protein GlmU-like C-terminal hexapeptide domain-containing protein n=1 Tax=Paraliobacillus quinghaiensis TaxID=470815 RepID=A0A917TDS9_9BACI|nr:hypothetical protein [Paraliobacillus quinghaiensis]GGM19125.1 hypothetical protein GCM10011351_01190 [Paraliobacillus quinghaiensis]